MKIVLNIYLDKSEIMRKILFSFINIIITYYKFYISWGINFKEHFILCKSKTNYANAATCLSKKEKKNVGLNLK